MKILLSAMFSWFVFLGYAQDLHFSQFYNSPLTINPALTGKADAQWRANVNYRSQWFSVPDSRGISTFAASVDARILEDVVPKYDKLGIGLQLYHDSAGPGYYNTTSILPSIAYHKALGYNHKLAAGLQPGYANTGIDFSRLSFETQYIGTGFDRSLPIGENLIAQNQGYLDLNGGLLYSFRSSDDVWDAFIGGGLFHINSPDISFNDGSTYARPARTVLNGGGNLYLDNGFVVSPSFLRQTQAGASELTIGTIIGKQLGNPRIVGDSKSAYGGLFWRQGDAIIGKAGVQYNNMQFGISNDFVTSDASNILGFSSGLEVSFTLIGLPDTDSKPIWCPSF